MFSWFRPARSVRRTLPPRRLQPITNVALLLCTTVLLAGCGDNGAARSPSSAAVPAGSAATPIFTRGSATATSTGVASAPADAEPVASADGSAVPDDRGAPDGSATASAAAADDGPLPKVEIHNIGMHIGGEDNTAEQKRPIRNDVSKHYDDMRRCYAKAESPARETTFGVDILIPRNGGVAKITNPRSGFKSRVVKNCLTEVFKKVAFRPAKKRRPLMVSFSVRFRR